VVVVVMIVFVMVVMMITIVMIVMAHLFDVHVVPRLRSIRCADHASR
jgi:hypothetical protein